MFIETSGIIEFDDEFSAIAVLCLIEMESSHQHRRKKNVPAWHKL